MKECSFIYTSITKCEILSSSHWTFSAHPCDFILQTSLTNSLYDFCLVKHNKSFSSICCKNIFQEIFGSSPYENLIEVYHSIGELYFNLSFIFQVEPRYQQLDWLVVALGMKDVLKFFTVVSGVLFVMIMLTIMQLKLYVNRFLDMQGMDEWIYM